MKISVIIPAFNAEKYLSRAIESVIDTGYKNLQIIVIDDGSKDQTRSVAKEQVKRYPKIVQVWWHADEKNRGVSASRNLGILRCKGDLVGFLDADDYLLPHRFDKAVNILETYPEIDGVYESSCIRIEPNESGVESGLGGAELDGAPFGLATSHIGAGLLRQLLTGTPWHPDAFLCRRTMFDVTGYFDETLRIAEDCHLWFRAAALCNIAPGELENPVAAYVRHDQNTYHYSIERKLDMIRAMLDAYRCISKSAGMEIKQVFRQGVTDYLEQSFISAREAHRNTVGWGLVRNCVENGGIHLLLERRALRQMYWLARETLFGAME